MAIQATRGAPGLAGDADPDGGTEDHAHAGGEGVHRHVRRGAVAIGKAGDPQVPGKQTARVERPHARRADQHRRQAVKLEEQGNAGHREQVQGDPHGHEVVAVEQVGPYRGEQQAHDVRHRAGDERDLHRRQVEPVLRLGEIQDPQRRHQQAAEAEQEPGPHRQPERAVAPQQGKRRQG